MPPTRPDEPYQVTLEGLRKLVQEFLRVLGLSRLSWWDERSMPSVCPESIICPG